MADTGFASQGNPTIAFAESVATHSQTVTTPASTTVTTPTTPFVNKQKNNTRKTSSLSMVETTMCGSTAGVVSRFVIAPLDVVKIRLQMQTQRKELPKVLRRNSFSGSQQTTTVKGRSGGESDSHKPRPRYRGMISGMATIAREEGIRGLWKGNMAAEYLYLAYGGVQFLIYERTKRHLSNTGQISAQRVAAMHLNNTPLHILASVANSSSAQSIISGSAAGIIATALTYPFDLLRTRFAVQRDVKVYTSVPQAFQHILHKEGIRGFYKGMSPALMQVVPYMGVMFGSYDTLKQTARWLKAKSDSSSSQVTSIRWFIIGLEDMLCGAISGVVSKTVVYPLDMVRKRLQIQGSEQQKAIMGVINSALPGKSNIAVIPTTARECMKQIVRQEGYLALYKGLLPGLVKAAPASAVTFLVYAQMSALFERIHHTEA
ncbi:mitochondrial thiamine pyrophosphate transporter [Entomortierella beljakovae]|nr:mitochondrial thiamine pyrophosphate transporter [Entomortierella beljakovae]